MKCEDDYGDADGGDDGGHGDGECGGFGEWGQHPACASGACGPREQRCEDVDLLLGTSVPSYD